MRSSGFNSLSFPQERNGSLAGVTVGSLDLAHQPGAGVAPIGFDGGFGNSQLAGNFRYFHAGEVSKHHHLRLARKGLPQFLNGFRQGNDVNTVGLQNVNQLLLGYSMPWSCPLLSTDVPRGCRNDFNNRLRGRAH